MSEAHKLLEKTLTEFDVFTNALVALLVFKKVFTIEELNEAKDAVRPAVIKVLEENKKQMKQALQKDEEEMWCKCPENKDGKIGFIRCTKCKKPRKP